MLKKITSYVILLLICGTVSSAEEPNYVVHQSVLPYVEDDLQRIERIGKSATSDVINVLCSYSSSVPFSELLEKASESSNDLSMEFVFTSTNCRLNSKTEYTPYGPALHKAVNNGLHTFNMTGGILRYLKNKPSEERRILFTAILNGNPAHRNLLEEILNSYKEDKDRRETLVRSARMVCKAIEVFELDRELGHYLYDTADGCRHPSIGYEPAKQ